MVVSAGADDMLMQSAVLRYVAEVSQIRQLLSDKYFSWVYCGPVIYDG
jgi:hypothetical protein